MSQKPESPLPQLASISVRTRSTLLATMSQEAKSLPHGYAALKKKTADLIDHYCKIAYEARLNAMKRL